MSKIYIDCVDQTLAIREAPRLASGGVNEDTVIFNFCPKWAGYASTAVFYANDDTKNVYHMALDEENSCKVPWETIVDEGWLNIGVFGVKGDVTRTGIMIKLRVSKGAITTETAVSDPTPDVYAQLLSRLCGVYVGSDEPADNSVSLWIDPDGTPTSSSGIHIGPEAPKDNTVVVWIDTDEEGGGSGGTSAPSDWNAKEGEAGHVLNRTHWVEEGMVELLPETAIVIMNDMPNVTAPVELEVGKTYSIVLNGTAYECVGVDGAVIDNPGFILCGNFASIGWEDNGLPFMLFNAPGMGIMLFCEYVEGSTLAIYEAGEVVHKLDNKFIDAEWMATTEKVLTTILPQADYTADVAIDNSYAWIENYEHPENAALDEMGLFVVGKKYIVSFNGVEYECEAFLYANSQPSDTGDPVGIGNPYVYRTIGNGWPTVDGEPEDNGIPFFITTHDVDGEVWGQVYTTEASTPINIGISRVDEAPSKLPEEYLPESVDGVIIRSSTAGSTKKFKLTVNDSGAITATEV